MHDTFTVALGTSMAAGGFMVILFTAGFLVYWRKMLDRPHYGVRISFLAGALLIVVGLGVAVFG